jgi:hypothetical protein
MVSEIGLTKRGKIIANFQNFIVFVFYPIVMHFSAISLEQVAFQGDDDVCFILEYFLKLAEK